MKILKFKSQNLMAEKGKKVKYLLPIFDGDETRKTISIDVEIHENAEVEFFVVGVIETSNIKFDLNSKNTGRNSVFKTDIKVIQFGNSQLDFTGLMRVEKGAKGTNADLHAESLILSKHAKASLVPGLEIEENEVSAGHGAVVKNIDPDQIYYLRSRGIDLEGANRLLIEGFVNSFKIKLPQEILDKFGAIIKTQLDKKGCLLNCEFCK